LSHGYSLAAQDGTLGLLLAWRQQLKLSLLIFSVLALMGGFSSALALLGDGSRPVNVVWAVGSLLGLHLLMLLLWVGSLIFNHHDGGGLLGRLWLWSTTRLGGARHRQVAAALGSMSGRHGLTPWILASVSHLLWTLALTGACLGLLLALALRSYQFGWETTILPSSVFIELVEVMGWLPASLGLRVPDTDIIALSGPALSVLASNNSILANAGLAWSSWLLGCLLIYGVLPRMLLTITCGLMLRRRLAAVRLDIHSGSWASWIGRLVPDSQSGGIIDPAPANLDLPAYSSNPQASGAPLILGLELAWPDSMLQDLALQAGDIKLLGPIDQREQRQFALHHIKQQAPARLLLACHANLSPDRGTIIWMLECAALCGETRILLVNAASAPPHRLSAWHESLAAVGVPASHLLDQQRAALHWLMGESVDV
jgi:hypothetical protein